MKVQSKAKNLLHFRTLLVLVLENFDLQKLWLKKVFDVSINQ